MKAKKKYVSAKQLTDLTFSLNPDFIIHNHCLQEIEGVIRREVDGKPVFDREVISTHMATCLTMQQNLAIVSLRLNFVQSVEARLPHD